MADPVQIKSGTPGFAGAIVDLMRALQSSFAPRSVVNRGAVLNNAIDGQVPTAPSSPPPANAAPAPRTSLGNQSPGLGNSF
jgi:hypothetical protein